MFQLITQLGIHVNFHLKNDEFAGYHTWNVRNLRKTVIILLSFLSISLSIIGSGV